MKSWRTKLWKFIKEKGWSFIREKGWYIFLLTISSLYVWHYRFEIYQFQEMNARNLVFILWLILLFWPLFNEMEFLGVKVKKEVEKATGEVKDSLSELRLQIMDLKISNSNANTIVIGDSLAPKEQLDKMLLNINDLPIVAKGEDKKANYTADKIEFDISEQTLYLFKVRLSLEQALSEICEKTGYAGDKRFRNMSNHLSRIGVLSSETSKIIHQIQEITNRGIHGEIISTEYIDFIKKALPLILKELTNSNQGLNYCICPKCKYQGYAPFENVCPRCGFVYDDD